MFRKYEKTYRVIVPQINIRGKHFLSKKDVKRLLGGKITISEKIDGANCGIIRNKNDFRLQKRGSLVGFSEHEQFNRLKAYSQEYYDKFMSIPKNTILYGEWCYCQHTVYYNNLPDWFLAFGWFDRKTNKYKSWDELRELCDKIGLHTVPHLYSGYINSKDELFNFMPDPSNCGEDVGEGIVIWNYRQQMRGKVVRAEFQKSMDEDGHWMYKKMTYNKIKNI